MSKSFGIYLTKPVEVAAIQVLGWYNFEAVWEFAISAMYVPAGYEHALRRDDERDPSNGNFYEDRAEQFVVLGTAGGPVRVDVGDWLVNEHGVTRAMSDQAFRAKYELAS